jgi:protocatechuate 3,4-dioxygenase beta subunit
VGSIITLIPEPERPNQIDLSLTTTTDTTGLFVFKSAAPGMYRITAWDELERNAHLDPEFMARYRDKGTLIAVDENVNQTVTLPAH